MSNHSTPKTVFSVTPGTPPTPPIPSADTERLAALDVPALEALIAGLEARLAAQSAMSTFSALAEDQSCTARLEALLIPAREVLAARLAAVEHMVQGAFPLARPDIHEIAATVAANLCQRFPGLSVAEAEGLVQDEIEDDIERARDEEEQGEASSRVFADNPVLTALTYVFRLETRCARSARHVLMSHQLAPHLGELKRIAGDVLDLLDERELSWELLLAAKDTFF